MDPDALAQPTRARLFALLRELRRPAAVDELAEATGLHPNGVRVHLKKLEGAGLVVRARAAGGAPGRPREEYAVVAHALPGEHEYRELARWLSRAVAGVGDGLAGVERRGREIGCELVDEPGTTGRPAQEALHAALSALGFAPELDADGGCCTFTLGACPYRDAVRENQPLVCTLHRGISAGMVGALAPAARLVEFTPHDPDAAGCRLVVEGL